MLKGKRQAVRLALQKRFPADDFQEIDRLDRSEALDDLLLAVMEARTASDARSAILAALRVG